MKNIKYWAVIAIIALLYITNPTQTDFNDWCKQAIKKEFGNSTLTSLTATLASPAIGKMTTRKDYYLCSVYEIADKQILGIGKQFFSLK